jgi:hypothetical protein
VNAVGEEAGWLPSTEATATFTVTLTPPSFNAAPSAASVNVGPNSPATVTLTFAPVLGFNGTITLTCINPPTGVTCAFNPASLKLNGVNPGTDVLTISYSGSGLLQNRSNPFLPAGATLAIAVCFLGWKKRRALLLALVLIAAAIWVMPATGCAGGGVSSTTITSSNMFVSATGGGAQQVVRITVNVVP